MRLQHWFLLGMTMLTAVGCGNQHAENREAALGRWQDVRVEMAVTVAQDQFDAGDLDAAAESLADALKLDAGNLDAQLLYGRVLLEQNQPITARRVLDGIVSVDGKHAEAHYYLGIIHEKWDDSNKAYMHYWQACESKPEQPAYVAAAAAVLVGRGQPDEALKLLDWYVDEVGPDSSVFSLAGSILAAQRRQAEALGMFKKARRFGDVKDRALTESLAYAYYHDGQADKALGLFDELAQGASNGGKAVSSHELVRGQCHTQLGQYHRAVRCFEVATQQEPDNAAAWTGLATVLLARGELERARNCAERAVALEPDSCEALVIMGYVGLKDDELAESAAVLRRAVDADRENGLAHCLLGQTLQGMGREEEAIGCYQQALAIDASDALALRLLNDRR